jgi:hypothetical protein
MLYVTCVLILLRRKRHGYIWHIASSTVLFLLETISLALGLVDYIYLYYQELDIAKGFTLSQAGSATSSIYRAATEITTLLCL